MALTPNGRADAVTPLPSSCGAGLGSASSEATSPGSGSPTAAAAEAAVLGLAGSCSENGGGRAAASGNGAGTAGHEECFALPHQVKMPLVRACIPARHDACHHAFAIMLVIMLHRISYKAFACAVHPWLLFVTDPPACGTCSTLRSPACIIGASATVTVPGRCLFLSALSCPSRNPSPNSHSFLCHRRRRCFHPFPLPTPTHPPHPTLPLIPCSATSWRCCAPLGKSLAVPATALSWQAVVGWSLTCRCGGTSSPPNLACTADKWQLPAL